MPPTYFKCRILEEELQRFWPDWHVVRQISEGSFADVFEIRRNEFGVEFASALKVIRHKDEEIELQTAEILDPFKDSFQENRKPGSGKKNAFRNSVKKIDTDTAKNYTDADTMPEVFQNEIRILEQLRGAPNVVNMEGLYYRKDGPEHVLYIRMELLTSIRDLLQANRKFSVPEIIRIGMDLCSALTCCEERHIIHRDIKPGNLFLDRYGTGKIGDFGVSRKMETVHLAHTMTGIGTISYMAPEIYRRRPYNNTVDIYALGLVLYQLLNRGRMPFMPDFPEDYTTADIDESNYLRLHGREIPSLLETLDTSFRKEDKEELDIVIRKACAYQPQDRFQTAREMKEALEDCLLHCQMHGSAKTVNDVDRDMGKAADKTPAPVAHNNSSESREYPAGEKQLPAENDEETNLIIDEQKKYERTAEQEVQKKTENTKKEEKKRTAINDPDNSVKGRSTGASSNQSKKYDRAEKKPDPAKRHKDLSREHGENKSQPLNFAVILLVLRTLLVVAGSWISWLIEYPAADQEKTVYDSDEWENVIKASGDGTYKYKYEIGDQIPLDLGEEGAVTMVLVAMDADELADGSGKAHMTWISKELLESERRMNPSYEKGEEGTGAQGGWKESEMRRYLAETIQPLFPQDLQSALKEVKKYSRFYNLETMVDEDQETYDSIWIPSKGEVFGSGGDGSEDEGVTYETVFGGEKSHIGASSASWWWLRSATSSRNFYHVCSDGSNYYSISANFEGGVVVGFCL